MGDAYVVGGSTVIDYNDKSICDLLTYFAENTYNPHNKNEEPSDYIQDVIKLMERDYRVVQIPNTDGNMCFQYPHIIPIMESHRNVTTIYENEDENRTTYLDKIKITELFNDAKLARCRQRFPVPVILFRGQNICRSSTIASLPEICYRNGLNDISSFEALYSIKEFLWPSEEMNPDAQEVREAAPAVVVPQPEELDKRAQTFCDKVRNEDIKVMKTFNVTNIVDIMVEKRKVKHGLYVSASEKVDRERYSGFRLLCLPYPGCEFFKAFHNAMFNAEGLRYNWDDPANDADICVPNDSLARALSIDWQQYRQWDLVVITQNYMRYILKRLQEDNTGLLIHCISGWDRTPLFISLIRMSLWADGLVHESLNEYEILYLTIAYDWYLFGHHLANRLYKKEEIMAFCFDFLKYITGEEYSIKASKKKHSDEKPSDESRSPSRSSNSSSVIMSMEDAIGHKDKRRNTGSGNDYFMIMNENSNDSSVVMDVGEVNFEDSNSPQSVDIHSNGEAMEISTPNGSAMDISISNGSLDGDRADEEFEVLPTEDALMDALNTEYFGKSKVLTPTNIPPKRTSPVPIGIPSRRTRSESTGSNASNVSSNWQMISECGSVEKEHFNLKPMRLQKLERVRTIFNSCYQKTVKKDSYGPPKKWVIEGVVSGLAQWLERNKPENLNQTKNGNAPKTQTSNGNVKNGNHDDNSAKTDSI